MHQRILYNLLYACIKPNENTQDTELYLWDVMNT